MSVNPAALNGLSEYLSSCKMAMPHMSDSLAHIQKLILATQTEALPSRDAFDAIRNHLMDWSDRDEANKIAMMAGEALGIKWRGKRSEEAISSTVPEKKARGEDPVRKEDAVKMTVKSFHGKARGRAVFRARLSQQMLVEEPVGRLDFLTPARWKSADSDPKEIASILQNEKMVVGIRRNLMIESIRDPKAAEETKKYIERQAADQLTRAGVSQEEVISTVRAMVGDAPLVLRQCGPHPLSSTEELLSDIDFLLDAASKTRSSADAIRLIREVSYSVPELLLTDQADERIQKAMIVLVNNGVPPREILTLFFSVAPPELSSQVLMNRVINNFLKIVPKLHNPVGVLNEIVNFLQIKEVQDHLSSPANQAVAEARKWIETLAVDDKRNIDACLVAVPLFLHILEGIPDKVDSMRFGLSSACLQIMREGLDVARSSMVKASYPGLRALSLLQMEKNPADLFDLRPVEYRTGDEREDFALFFHHLLAAARQVRPEEYPGSDIHGQNLIALLDSRFRNSPYSTAIRHWQQIIDREPGALSTILRDEFFSFCNSLVPKKERAPGIDAAAAQRLTTQAVLTALARAETPSVLLKDNVLIDEMMTQKGFEKALGPMKELIKLLELPYYDAVRERIVKNFFVPLFGDVFFTTPPSFNVDTICELLNDMAGLLQNPRAAPLLLRSLSPEDSFPTMVTRILGVRRQVLDGVLCEASASDDPVSVLKEWLPALPSEMKGDDYQLFGQTLTKILMQLRNSPEEVSLIKKCIIPLLRRVAPILNEGGMALTVPEDGRRILADLMFLALTLDVSHDPTRVERMERVASAEEGGMFRALDQEVTACFEIILGNFLQKVALKRSTGLSDSATYVMAFLDELVRILQTRAPEMLNTEIMERLRLQFFTQSGQMKDVLLPALKTYPKEMWGQILRDHHVHEIIDRW